MNLADTRVRENRCVERCGLFGLMVEPEKWRDALEARLFIAVSSRGVVA
jgi:hypothetical protein